MCEAKKLKKKCICARNDFKFYTCMLRLMVRNVFFGDKKECA